MTRYPRYPECKDSGVEWLGEIPSQWSTVRLKFAANVNMGQSPSSEEYNMKGEGLPFLQGNAEFGKKHPSPKLYCPTANKVAEPSSLLLSVRAPVGALNVADQCYGIGRGLCAITPSKELDDKFAWYLITLTRIELDVLATGSTYEAVSVDEVENMSIVLPSLPEQRAIAAFLDRQTANIDAAIDEYRCLAELLGEKRAALISHAVTQGLDPDVPRQDSGIEWVGEIPAHWSVKRLKFVANVQTGVAKGRNLEGKETIEVPYLRVANVQSGFVDLSDVAMILIGRDEIERYLLRTGDILMTEGGDYDKLGRGTVWDGRLNPCIHQNHIFAVRAQSEASSYWISLTTRADYARHYFILRSKQSTNLASISATNIMEFPVLLPPMKEQETISGNV